MSNNTLPAKLAINMICYYQKHISPYKGFCCAQHALTGEPSCSEFTKRAIEQHGLLRSMPFIRQQFINCKKSMQELKRDIKKEWKDANCTELTHCGGDTAACCCSVWI